MRTTTDPKNFRFHFTVTDLARFLGKSPVTLRHWERQGLVVFPRDTNGDRKLTTQDIRYMARIAENLGRITEERKNLVEASITMLQLVEQENDDKGSIIGSAVSGQNGHSTHSTVRT